MLQDNLLDIQSFLGLSRSQMEALLEMGRGNFVNLINNRDQKIHVDLLKNTQQLFKKHNFDVSIGDLLNFRIINEKRQTKSTIGESKDENSIEKRNSELRRRIERDSSAKNTSSNESSQIDILKQKIQNKIDLKFLKMMEEYVDEALEGMENRLK